MITNDGLKWKTCFLENDLLFIDGESYPIENIKEITKYGTVFRFFIGLVAIGIALYVFGLFMLINININPFLVNDTWKNIILCILLSPFAAILVLTINLFSNWSNYSGYWTVNHYHSLWIEKDDHPNIVANLRQLENRLPKSNAMSIPKKHLSLKIIILGIIGTIVAVSSVIIPKNNGILIPLLFTGGFLIIFIAAFWDCFEGYKRSKWKK